MLDMRDVNGVYLFVAMNELVEEKSSPKVSYVVLVKHGDKNYVAASGMYDVTSEDIKAKFPGDSVYEE